MEPNRFDHLSRALAAHGPRRSVLGLLTAVPIVGGLLGILSSEETEAAGRRKRRKKAHKHGKGRRRKHGSHKKKCTPTTCVAEGKTCGSVADGCGMTLDCGPCTCATGCPDCQTCNPATGLCDPVTNGTTCNDGDACTQSATCQNGVCAGSNPVVCTPLCETCVDGECVVDATQEGQACNTVGGTCLSNGTCLTPCQGIVCPFVGSSGCCGINPYCCTGSESGVDYCSNFGGTSTLCSGLANCPRGQFCNGGGHCSVACTS